MSEHKAEAERLIDLAAQSQTMKVAEIHVSCAAAQVHATLYLAEQQRIANIIALLGRGKYAVEIGEQLDRLKTGVAGEVWDGLGLS